MQFPYFYPLGHVINSLRRNEENRAVKEAIGKTRRSLYIQNAEEIPCCAVIYKFLHHLYIRDSLIFPANFWRHRSSYVLTIELTCRQIPQYINIVIPIRIPYGRIVGTTIPNIIVYAWNVDPKNRLLFVHFAIFAYFHFFVEYKRYVVTVTPGLHDI